MATHSVNTVVRARDLLIRHATTAKQALIDELESGHRNYTTMHQLLTQYEEFMIAADVLNGDEHIE